MLSVLVVVAHRASWQKAFFLSRRHLELYISFIQFFLTALGSRRKEPKQPDPVWVIFGVSGGSHGAREVLPAGPGSVQAPRRHD